MLQSFALQNSSLNFKSTKHENVTHFIKGKGGKANTSGKLLLSYIISYVQGLFSTFTKTARQKMSLWMIHRNQVNQFANA